MAAARSIDWLSFQSSILISNQKWIFLLRKLYLGFIVVKNSSVFINNPQAWYFEVFWKDFSQTSNILKKGLDEKICAYLPQKFSTKWYRRPVQCWISYASEQQVLELKLETFYSRNIEVVYIISCFLFFFHKAQLQVKIKNAITCEHFYILLSPFCYTV